MTRQTRGAAPAAPQPPYETTALQLITALANTSLHVGQWSIALAVQTLADETGSVDIRRLRRMLPPLSDQDMEDAMRISARLVRRIAEGQS
jgi:hypothetical protein